MCIRDSQNCVAEQTTTVTVESQLNFDNLSVNCNANGSQYVVSFDLTNVGTTTPTIIQGNGTLNGNAFLSDSLPTSDPYVFQINNGVCPPLTISGVPNCGCLTEAGNLVVPGQTPLQFCENEIASIPPVQGGNLDINCLLYTSPSPRDRTRSRMPSSA